MIHLYRYLCFLLIPLIKLNLFIRLKNKKEDLSRYKERFGCSKNIINYHKEIIWIHAASVGEFKSAKFLIQEYSEDYKILITTTTLSAANYAKEYYGEKIIHQFAPLDVSIWINRFLKKWNPKMVIWIESDLWPNTLHIIKKRNINAILLNLRLSPKSLNRWKIFPSFYNNLMNCFSEVYAQSQIDLTRIKKLTSKKINYIGNLKLTNIINQKKIKKKYYKNNSDKITIMLASTHDNEEYLIIPILKNLLIKNKNLRFILAPRHIERVKKIESICLKNKLSYNLESNSNFKDEDILIINSFGILDNYFLISDIVFLGGSLVSSGGHNPIEPGFFNCAILTGYHLFNWQDIYNQMICNNACIKINSIEDLKNVLDELLEEKSKIEILKNNAYNFSKKQFFDKEHLKQLIDKNLNSRLC